MTAEPLFRTNTVIRRIPCRNRDKTEILSGRLAERPDGAELFRVRTADAGAALLRFLKKRDRDPRLLLSNQSEPEIARTEAWYASADRPSLIVAEIAPLPAARQDVRAVYIMNLPLSLAFVRDDIAAAGRDGLDSSAEIFASRADYGHRFDRLEQTCAGKDLLEKMHRLNECVSWMEHDGCARVFLAYRLDNAKIGVCGNCGWCLGRRGMYLPEE